ncbi:MAG: hypothetical protein FLDDKLPJ_00104 [Phycisphaerae bacterium]|nr:hypothetical protein [Phycisphaerae bacterium]
MQRHRSANAAGWHPQRAARRSAPSWRRRSAAALLLVIPVIGCGAPPKLATSAASSDARSGCAWWVAGEGDGRLVVGLEHRNRGGDAEVWLVARAGARRFRFTGAKPVSWGPPLAENDVNFTVEAPPAVKAWLAATGDFAVRAGLSGFINETVSGRSSASDLVDALRRCAGGLERPAPVSSHEAWRALFEFPTGLKELLALNKSLG